MKIGIMMEKRGRLEYSRKERTRSRERKKESKYVMNSGRGELLPTAGRYENISLICRWSAKCCCDRMLENNRFFTIINVLAYNVRWHIYFKKTYISYQYPQITVCKEPV